MAMIIYRALIGGFTGLIFGLLLYVGLIILTGSTLRGEHSLYMAIIGAVIGILSLRLMPWIVHLAGLAGMILGVALELLLAGYLWPGMPYERVLSYLLGAGLAGMVSAGLIASIVLKHRANQQM
ncbi:hypothetical protein ABNM12_22355 [Pseudomonas syringae]|nr:MULTISPECIES: hypothetical protein [Pseudomonas]KWS08575.1 hypothetical protein AL063_21175 [Pseudomonas syringae pv. syringae]KWS28426.1 hypothetical protein AL062_07590 [Pseudomonas syringae pv. syringae]KWS29109.1 hypothetical protein AL061_08075 [Pseudomonas syringae pv. syringae]MCA5967915.1 hypothetical protein [Pseudomonas sp. P129]MCH5499984.1 hypothetical protein [Pseudomonas syringae pv. syringae]